MSGHGEIAPTSVVPRNRAVVRAIRPIVAPSYGTHPTLASNIRSMCSRRIEEFITHLRNILTVFPFPPHIYASAHKTNTKDSQTHTAEEAPPPLDRRK